MTDRAAFATTGDLAALLGAELVGPPDLPITGISGLDEAVPGDLTFIRSRRFAGRWAASRASAAIISRGIEADGHDPERRALLVVENADRSMLTLLSEAEARAPRSPPVPGVHPTAIVAGGVEIPENASIGPFVVIEAGAKIGAAVEIGAYTIVGDRARVGDGTRLHSRVTVMPGVKIGRECEIFPGVVLGADGFGYLPGPDGPLKVPHLARVTIGDRVEIGANTTIDRGKFADTTIGDATKIDNQVQIGHSCRVGRAVIICGCCAIGGSTIIGDGAILGGHLSVRDNIEIEAGAMIAGASAIDSRVSAGEPWFGWPARPVSISKRAMVATLKLPNMRHTLRELAQRVQTLEEQGR